MIKIAEFNIVEVFEAFDKGKEKIGGASLKNNRIINFRIHGVVCKSCGINGNVFIAEKEKQEHWRPHLNFYHISKSTKRLMTKDHIKPISLGGSGCVHNLQSMCDRNKSARYSVNDRVSHLISLVKHKLNNKCNCNIFKALV